MAKGDTQFTSVNAPRNGRPKSSPNRTTAEMREFLQQVVDRKMDELDGDLDKMSPTNQWIILEKLTKYFLPSLSANSNINVNSGDIKILVEYADEKKPEKPAEEPVE